MKAVLFTASSMSYLKLWITPETAQLPASASDKTEAKTMREGDWKEDRIMRAK